MGKSPARQARDSSLSMTLGGSRTMQSSLSFITPGGGCLAVLDQMRLHVHQAGRLCTYLYAMPGGDAACRGLTRVFHGGMLNNFRACVCRACHALPALHGICCEASLLPPPGCAWPCGPAYRAGHATNRKSLPVYGFMPGLRNLLHLQVVGTLLWLRSRPILFTCRLLSLPRMASAARPGWSQLG